MYWDTKHERTIIIGDWKWHETNDSANAVYEMVEVDMGQKLRKLSDDPGEKINLLDEHPAKAEEMLKILESWQEKIKADHQ